MTYSKFDLSINNLQVIYKTNIYAMPKGTSLEYGI